jgi:hypothetical protein
MTVFDVRMNAVRRTALQSIALLAVSMGASSVAARTPAPALAARRALRPPPPMTATIQWDLEARPSTVPFARRSTFRLWLVARNVGSTPMDTQRDRLEWFVNGRRSHEIEMAFGNGARTGEWSALAPRATAREAREGAWLLPSVGTFVFSIRMNGREVARRVVIVQ